MATILLVDDDRDLVDLLSFAFQRAGFAVLAAHDPHAAHHHLAGERSDLAVLDINLGPWDGFDVLRDLRQRTRIPVILLTARDGEADKVLGLELGADDYVTKPFSHRELIARVRAHLRRQGQDGTMASTAILLQVGPLAINVAEHRVTKHGQQVDLSVTEFRLLHYLMTQAGAVVPTRGILKHVWGYDDPAGTDVVRVTVHRLRRKLEEDPANPQLLHTIPGLGIMLKTQQS